jgi:hypothetical protein
VYTSATLSFDVPVLPLHASGGDGGAGGGGGLVRHRDRDRDESDDDDDGDTDIMTDIDVVGDGPLTDDDGDSAVAADDAAVDADDDADDGDESDEPEPDPEPEPPVRLLAPWDRGPREDRVKLYCSIGEPRAAPPADIHLGPRPRDRSRSPPPRRTGASAMSASSELFHAVVGLNDAIRSARGGTAFNLLAHSGGRTAEVVHRAAGLVRVIGCLEQQADLIERNARDVLMGTIESFE